jgi:hypothetical protein
VSVLGILQSLRLRFQRQRCHARAWRKSRELRVAQDRTKLIKPGDILVFSTFRNEAVRLPYFFQYYRDLGVDHFIMVDNDSTDGGGDYAIAQPDVSVWTTKHSYKAARYGVDWLNYLQRRYAHNHWTLVVDPDEFFVFPYCDTRPIRALTDWLEASAIRSFGAMMLDMYPKGPISAQPYALGTDPFQIACWFDPGNYVIARNWQYGNLWIQGGPRARSFFADTPAKAPALNKIPLVKWQRGYAYVSSTHMLLPRGLNRVYEEWGGEKTSGVLLHAKFLDTFSAKAAEELERGQHYAASAEYKAYHDGLSKNPDFWTKWSERYINWRQLEILGLMSKGNWA